MASLLLQVKKKVIDVFTIVQRICLRFDDNELTEGTGWIVRLCRAYIAFIRLFPNFPARIFIQQYCAVIVKRTDENPSLKAEIKERWLRFFDANDDDTRMFMTHLFLQSRIFDEDVTRRMMAFAAETKNPAYRYWVTMDVSLKTYELIQGFYPEYYTDRRRLFKMIAEESDIKLPPREARTDSQTKICVITYLLYPSMYNSTQRTSVMFANNLQHLGADVTVVSLESFYKTVSDGRKIITLYKRFSPRWKKKEIKAHFNENVKVKYAHGRNFRERLQSVIQIIYSCNPDIILDISDEFSPMSYFYAQDFFTVYQPMRVSASSQFFTKILGTDFKIRKVNDLYHFTDERNILHWTFPEFVPPEMGTMTKRDLGVNDDAFVIVSVGNNTVFNNSEIDCMNALLTDNPSFVWLLIGMKGSSYLHTAYGNLLKDKRVIEWGFENNLAGLYRACDVLLRNNQSGGSGATAIAAMQGLPIVMTNYLCDASRWLGADYSNVSNFQDLMGEIEKLCNNRQYYEQRSALVRKLIGQNLDCEEKWKQLYDLLQSERTKWEAEKVHGQQH